MLTSNTLIKSILIVCSAVLFTGCSSYHRTAPTPIDYKARFLMSGYKEFNLTDQECSGNSGSSIYGNVTDRSGVQDDYQKAEAWNTCGAPLDSSTRSRLLQPPQRNDSRGYYRNGRYYRY